MNGGRWTCIKWTREELETDPGTTGEVWRKLMQFGPSVISQFYETDLDRHRAQEATRRLESHGWARRCGKRDREFIFEALEKQDLAFARPEPSNAPSRIRRRRIGRCVRIATKARRSALAVEMASALLEIERELRAIVEGES